MEKINAKRAIKAMESQNVFLQATLEKSQSKVKQLKDQYVILSNNLIVADEETEQLKDQTQKAKTELDKLRKELIECKSEKDDLAGKPKMALTELDSTKALINRMNTRSKKLDEILGSQRTDKLKIGIGYTHGASMSKGKGKPVFVEGPNVYCMAS